MRRQICTVRRAKWTIGTLTFVVAIVQAIALFPTGVIDIINQRSSIGRSPGYYQLMRVLAMMETVFTLVIPPVLIVIMNGFIIQNLFSFRRTFQSTGSSRRTSSHHQTKIKVNSFLFPIFITFNKQFSNLIFESRQVNNRKIHFGKEEIMLNTLSKVEGNKPDLLTSRESFRFIDASIDSSATMSSNSNAKYITTAVAVVEQHPEFSNSSSAETDDASILRHLRSLPSLIPFSSGMDMSELVSNEMKAQPDVDSINKMDVDVNVGSRSELITRRIRNPMDEIIIDAGHPTNDAIADHRPTSDPLLLNRTIII